jgi:hypothetical protein
MTERKDFDVTSPVPKLSTVGCSKFSRETQISRFQKGDSTVSDECEAVVINCLDLTTE